MSVCLSDDGLLSDFFGDAGVEQPTLGYSEDAGEGTHHPE